MLRPGWLLRAGAAVLPFSFSISASASAQVHDEGPLPLPALSITYLPAVDVTPAQTPALTPSLLQAVPRSHVVEPHRRPPGLVPLYASLVGLNALDVHSTYSALKTPHAAEANPIVAPLVHQPAAFIALKAGTTAVSIWTAERLWKKHRVVAMVIVGSANAALAAVVTNNYRIAKK